MPGDKKARPTAPRCCPLGKNCSPVQQAAVEAIPRPPLQEARVHTRRLAQPRTPYACACTTHKRLLLLLVKPGILLLLLLLLMMSGAPVVTYLGTH